MFTGIFWSMLNATLATALTAGVFFFTSRLLAPADFGHVALATAIVMFAAAIVPIAFGEALVQREDIGQGHLNGVFWICTGIATAFYVLLLVASGPISTWLETDILAQILPILSIKLIFDAMAVTPEALVFRRMEFRTIALRTAIANTLAGAVCLYMAFNGYALWALVASQVLSSLINLVITAWAAGWLPGWPSGVQSVRQIASFGIYSMGSRILDGARIDQFLIGALLGPVVLGYYFFAVRINNLLQRVTTQALSVVFSVSFSAVQTDRERSKELYLSGSFFSATLAFPVFGGLILVAATAVPLIFGPQWIEAVLVVKLTAAIGIMASIGILQAALIRASGGARWWFSYRVLAHSVGFLAIVGLSPYGISAIAAGLLARTVLLWPLSVAKTLRLLGMGFGEYCSVFVSPSASLAVMSLVVLAIPMVFPATSDGAILIIQVLLGICVYSLTMFLTARRRIKSALRNVLRSKEVNDA